MHMYNCNYYSVPCLGSNQPEVVAAHNWHGLRGRLHAKLQSERRKKKGNKKQYFIHLQCTCFVQCM